MSASSAPARPSLLRDARFRSFFVADSVSQLGDRISELAFPLIAVLVLNASTAEVSVLTALVWLPNLVSPVVGAWVDRQERKQRLLVSADLLRALLLLTVSVAFVAGSLTLLQLYVVALLTGAGAVLFNTTYPAFFVLLVDRPDYLAANSLTSSSRSVSFVAGPAIGGALISVVTAPVSLLVDAASFLWSALFLSRIRLDRGTSSPRPPERTSLIREAREGLGFTLREPVLRASLGCLSTVNFFTFVSAALLVLFASQELGLSSALIGATFGVGAIGGLLGAVTAPALSRLIGVGWSIIVGAVLFPAPIALIAVADGPVWARAGLLGLSEFLSGLGVMYLDVNGNALKAVLVPDGMRSRVSGAFSMINYGTRPLGALAGGAIGTWLGLRPALWVAAVGGVLGVLWLLPSSIPRIRSLDEMPHPGTPVEQAP